MMKTGLLLVLGFCLAGGPLAAQSDPEPRTLYVVGRGSVEAVPDMADITLGVTEESSQADLAASAVSRAAAAIFDTLGAVGIAASDVQTRDFQLTPVFDRRAQDGGPPRVIGYRASYAVHVTVRELNDLGMVLSETLESGATEFRGLSFDLSDRTRAEEIARRAAIQDARTKAATYADAAEVGLGPVMEIAELVGGTVPVGGGVRASSLAMEAVPVAPGGLVVLSEVAMTFMLTQ
ncbi:MAG: SIMPL domain-containing protein [Pseudomonadota bacterium]